MLWITATGVLLIIIIVLYVYLRITKSELAKLSLRLRFINENATCLELFTNVKIKELDMLVQQINYMLSIHKNESILSKRTEQEFKQAITNLSHDLRTPLTSASGYIQMLKSDKIPQSKKEEYIDIIGRRIDFLRKMLDTLFEFSRLQSDEYTFDLQKVDVCAVLIDVISTYYDDFNLRKVTPEINLEKDSLFIFGDKDALKRIFENLISNALKHSYGAISINVLSNSGFIEIKFRNFTDQLTEDDMDQLFNRFFTSDKSRSSNNTGLGLAIVKELVNRTGGEISVSLEENFLTFSIKYILI